MMRKFIRNFEEKRGKKPRDSNTITRLFYEVNRKISI